MIPCAIACASAMRDPSAAGDLLPARTGLGGRGREERGERGEREREREKVCERERARERDRGCLQKWNKLRGDREERESEIEGKRL